MHLCTQNEPEEPNRNGRWNSKLIQSVSTHINYATSSTKKRLSCVIKTTAASDVEVKEQRALAAMVST